MKDKKEAVEMAKMAEMTPEAREFWAEYRQRMKLREEATKKLVEPRKLK